MTVLIFVSSRIKPVGWDFTHDLETLFARDPGIIAKVTRRTTSQRRIRCHFARQVPPPFSLICRPGVKCAIGENCPCSRAFTHPLTSSPPAQCSGSVRTLDFVFVPSTAEPANHDA
jgi:hypothetical protein